MSWHPETWFKILLFLLPSTFAYAVTFNTGLFCLHLFPLFPSPSTPSLLLLLFIARANLRATVNVFSLKAAAELRSFAGMLSSSRGVYKNTSCQSFLFFFFFLLADALRRLIYLTSISLRGLLLCFFLLFFPFPKLCIMQLNLHYDQSITGHDGGTWWPYVQ